MYAFVDTNILVEYLQLDQIDWLTLLGKPHVTLAIAPVVLRELEDHKRGAKARLRQRADAAVKYLFKVVGEGMTGPVRTGVDLMLLPKDPDFDFAAHGLVRDIDDDWLLATALTARAAGEEVAVVTNDSTLRLKARGSSPPLANVCPADTMRLPAEEDPVDKELRETKARLAALEGAIPKVRLAFEDGDTRCSIQLAPPEHSPTPEEVSGLIEAEDEQLRIHRALQKDQDEDHFGRFNVGLYRFSYRAYVNRLQAQEAALRRCVVLALKLLNDGKVPADEVHLFLTLPRHVRVCNPTTAPRISAPPERPGGNAKHGLVPPWATATDLPFNYEGSDHLDFVAREQQGANQVLRYELPLLMHSMQRWLAPMILAFDRDEDLGSFTIPYRLLYRRAPGAAEGVLHVQLLPSQ